MGFSCAIIIVVVVVMVIVKMVNHIFIVFHLSVDNY